MIGNPVWFKRRKYAGWGFFPVKWQGWVYIAVMIVPFVIFQALPFWNNTTRIAVTIIWFIVFGLDAIDIMIRMKKDERETLHEAIAERNALWFIIIALAIGVAYQAASNAVQQRIYVDPVIVIALVGGLLVKAISNIYLDRKD